MRAANRQHLLHARNCECTHIYDPPFTGVHISCALLLPHWVRGSEDVHVSCAKIAKAWGLWL